MMPSSLKMLRHAASYDVSEAATVSPTVCC